MLFILFPTLPLFLHLQGFVNKRSHSCPRQNSAGHCLQLLQPYSVPSKTSANLQFPVPECQTELGESIFLPVLIADGSETPPNPTQVFVPAVWQPQCHSCCQLLLRVRCRRALCPKSFPAGTAKHAGYAAAPALLLLCSADHFLLNHRSFYHQPDWKKLSSCWQAENCEAPLLERGWGWWNTNILKEIFIVLFFSSSQQSREAISCVLLFPWGCRGVKHPGSHQTLLYWIKGASFCPFPWNWLLWRDGFVSWIGLCREWGCCGMTVGGWSCLFARSKHLT